MLFRQVTLDQVNRAVETLDGAAGKSINVAKVLHSLGASVIATGFLGGPRGKELADGLRALGLDLEFVSVPTPTRQCITVIDQSKGTVTELVEESRAVPPEAYDQLLGIVRKYISRCSAIVLSGTIASGGPTDFYLQCATMAREAGVLCVLDASGRALIEALKANPRVVKPNRSELETTLGRSLPDETSLQAAMRELHARGAQGVVITSGAHPALAFDGRLFWRITPPKIAALNPIGSGDAFTAALAWRLIAGSELADACRWASAAGAANALTPMAGELNRPDLDRLLPQVRIEQLGP
jgi:tagatose 6-phosphate kinase